MKATNTIRSNSRTTHNRQASTADLPVTGSPTPTLPRFLPGAHAAQEHELRTMGRAHSPYSSGERSTAGPRYLIAMIIALLCVVLLLWSA